jgi:hypothetical protein
VLDVQCWIFKKEDQRFVPHYENLHYSRCDSAKTPNTQYQISNIKGQVNPHLGVRCWIFCVGYLKKESRSDITKTFTTRDAIMQKYPTLNIKYPTSKVKLTETSVFDVGYLVLDILKKPFPSSRKPHYSRCDSAKTPNTQYQISNTKGQVNPHLGVQCWMFSVGYLKRKIRDPFRITKTFTTRDVIMQNIKHSISNIKHRRSR